jgi:hypothetical protein
MPKIIFLFPFAYKKDVFHYMYKYVLQLMTSQTCISVITFFYFTSNTFKTQIQHDCTLHKSLLCCSMQESFSICLKGWKFLYQVRDINFSRILLHEVSMRMKACMCKNDFSVQQWEKYLETFQDQDKNKNFINETNSFTESQSVLVATFSAYWSVLLLPFDNRYLFKGNC